jgi:hypothetical protein
MLGIECQKCFTLYNPKSCPRGCPVCNGLSNRQRQKRWKKNIESGKEARYHANKEIRKAKFEEIKEKSKGRPKGFVGYSGEDHPHRDHGHRINY